MSTTEPQGHTLADLMILVAAAAAGAWGAAAYRAGIPIPIVAPPSLPLLPLFLSLPPAAALTWAFIVMPVRTLRERTRRLTDQPGTALCIGVAAAILGVLARWSLRAWIRPYADGSPLIYGAQILYDWASWCGLGVAAILALLALCGHFRRQAGWAEVARFGLTVYWVLMFLIFGAL